MNGHRRTFLALACSVLLVAAAAAQQAPVNPRPAAPRPNDEGAAPGKLVAPARGTVELGFTAPVSKRSPDNKTIVTTIKVKNMASGAIAGLKVDEFWYNKAGDPVSGDTYRHRKPLQPGEVLEIVLRTPISPNMDRNSYKFTHANGDIKTTRVPKL